MKITGKRVHFTMNNHHIMTFLVRFFILLKISIYFGPFLTKVVEIGVIG